MLHELLNFLKENKESIEVLTSLLTTTFTLVGAIIIPIMLARITGNITHQNSLALQLNDKKREAFNEFIDTLFDEVLREKELSETEKKMLTFKKKLILNASEDTLREFNRWIKESRNAKKDDTAPLKSMDRLIYSLRKDTGVIDRRYAESRYLRSTLGKWLEASGRFIGGKKQGYDRVQLMLNEEFKE